MRQQIMSVNGPPTDSPMDEDQPLLRDDQPLLSEHGSPVEDRRYLHPHQIEQHGGRPHHKVYWEVFFVVMPLFSV
jgi:hypothetical protein